jgi:hypothetical protein
LYREEGESERGRELDPKKKEGGGQFVSRLTKAAISTDTGKTALISVARAEILVGKNPVFAIPRSYIDIKANKYLEETQARVIRTHQSVQF